MSHLDRYGQQVSFIHFFTIFLPGSISLGLYYLGREILDINPTIVIVAVGIIFTVLGLVAYFIAKSLAFSPLQNIWQAVWHVSPGKSDTPPPKLENLKYGRELVSALVHQIYDLASHNPAATAYKTDQTTANNGVLDQVPLALFVLNKERVVTTLNTAAQNYLGISRDKIIGKSVYDVLRMSFLTDDTFDVWIQKASTTRATDSRSWEHVRATLEDNKPDKQFDLAASYSRDDSLGNEVVLALFDRTDKYSKQDESTSYVALAVHELRTPLTVLRGYIEVFEDELGDSLSPEHKEFMRKMSAAAQSLTAFVSNILNVARVDQNQMTLSLHEANWNEVLTSIVKDLQLRASVRGKTLELDITPDLPTVAIDKISIYEVVSNLIENAIKYSGQGNRIIIHSSLGKSGSIETVVEDFGPGMPESTVSELFTKFYRSHISKNAVSGSGLGLYLVKSIVTAHGGQVWVNSQVGKGSRFGFSLQTFASIKQNEAAGQDGIERQASGWIKNHSMYRR
jgi:signal transduction histidine kinase